MRWIEAILTLGIAPLVRRLRKKTDLPRRNPRPDKWAMGAPDPRQLARLRWHDYLERTGRGRHWDRLERQIVAGARARPSVWRFRIPTPPSNVAFTGADGVARYELLLRRSAPELVGRRLDRLTRAGMPAAGSPPEADGA